MIDTSEIGVFLGLDVGKGEHHATAVTPAGKKALDKRLPNSEPKLRELFEKLQAKHGIGLVVVDQPASIGALPLAVARNAGCQVANLPGLTMRRIADLCPGEAKTDARDAFIIADAARVMPHTLREGRTPPTDQPDTGQGPAHGRTPGGRRFHSTRRTDGRRPGHRCRRTDRPQPGRQLKSVLDQRKLLPTRIEELLESHPLSAVLTSMPGIGVRTGARILIDVGDGRSFPTAAHLAAYAGLAPDTRSSGSSIRGEQPSRRRSKQLKRAFFLSACAALADPASRAYYDKKIKQGKHHTQALLCLARRRADVLFAILRDGTFYGPQRTPAG